MNGHCRQMTVAMGVVVMDARAKLNFESIFVVISFAVPLKNPRSHPRPSRGHSATTHLYLLVCVCLLACLSIYLSIYLTFYLSVLREIIRIFVEMGVGADMGVDADMGVSVDMGVGADMGVDMGVGVSVDMGVGVDMGVSMDMGVGDAHLRYRMFARSALL